MKKPIPFPPDVKASKRPCDTVDKNITIPKICFLFLPNNKANKIAQMIAKNMECVNPRCPKGCEYGIFNLNAITSRSGSMAEAIAKKSKTLLETESTTFDRVKPTKP